jgi:hypothetical protein
MRRGSYLRLTVRQVPANTTAAYLFLLALVSRPVGLHEGFLADDIRVREPIRLLGRDGQAIFTSPPVTRIEVGFALTDGNRLLQLVRVPTSICDVA